MYYEFYNNAIIIKNLPIVDLTNYTDTNIFIFMHSLSYSLSFVLN